MNHVKALMENKQVYLYFIALILGAILGLQFTTITASLEVIVPILLAILMFGMFTQIPFLQITKHRINIHYILALILSNFVLIPMLVFVLMSIFNVHTTPIMIGAYLVLLTPCIDYVIVFTNLGQGNTHYMLMSTPILLILQLMLLPIYLSLFIDKQMIAIIDFKPFLESFTLIILIPLICAVILQLLSRHSKSSHTVLNLTEWLPVPFMALVLFAVVSSQIGKISHDFSIVLSVIPLYIAFAIMAPIIAILLGKLFKLSPENIRTLAFSSSTRNALVVLPLALSLPSSWAIIATTVVVTQTIIELMSELVYIKVIPAIVKHEK